MTHADHLIAALSREAEAAGHDVPETQLLAAAACDWARVHGEYVAACAAMAGPLTAQQRRAANRELRQRAASMRKSLLDARGVPALWRVLTWLAPPPWNTVLALASWVVMRLIERWSDDPLELAALAHPPGA